MITDSQFELILKDLSEKVAIPFVVPVRPETNAPYRFCFPSVKAKIKSDGGEMVIGWILHRELYFIELECHAIWKSLNGELVDITQKETPHVNQILFLPDLNILYEGKRINNIMVNPLGLKMVDHLRTVNKLIFDITDKGDRASNLGEINLEGAEAAQYIYLQGEKNELVKFINNNHDEDYLCFCMSGKSFGDCHFNNYDEHCWKILEKYDLRKS
ncbi:MAG: zinc chelation protein SecC [Bacteroidetes bacterium]|nr:zinc chelation protein SecC [Bacteroidota bacterium]